MPSSRTRCLWKKAMKAMKGDKEVRGDENIIKSSCRDEDNRAILFSIAKPLRGFLCLRKLLSDFLPNLFFVTKTKWDLKAPAQVTARQLLKDIIYKHFARKNNGHLHFIFLLSYVQLLFIIYRSVFGGNNLCLWRRKTRKQINSTHCHRKEKQNFF